MRVQEEQLQQEGRLEEEAEEQHEQRRQWERRDGQQLRAVAPPPGEGQLSNPGREARIASIFAPPGVT